VIPVGVRVRLNAAGRRRVLAGHDAPAVRRDVDYVGVEVFYRDGELLRVQWDGAAAEEHWRPCFVEPDPDPGEYVHSSCTDTRKGSAGDLG
jgi:hypothetical protein